METKEAGLFMKIISIFDQVNENHPENTIKVKEDPNSKQGTATKVWDCVRRKIGKLINIPLL